MESPVEWWLFSDEGQVGEELDQFQVGRWCHVPELKS